MEAAKDAASSAKEGAKNLVIGDGKKKDKKDKKKSAGGAGGDGRPLELHPPPPFIAHRVQLFEKLRKKYDDDVARKPRDEIMITLGDGKIVVGKAWETTPALLVRQISKSLSERTVISRVDGEELWDLERPLEKSCHLEFLDFDHPEGKKVFWHSSAHVLGEAAERRFGCNLCIGPPVDDGFYYEMGLPDR
jgi:threonyl-tRNA synthetase